VSADLEWARRHWLAAANLLVAVFVALPVLAPLLAASGYTDIANPIYAAYHFVCHQWAFRSYFVLGAGTVYGPDVLASLVGTDQMYGFVGSPELGYKVAFCERDLAIYLSVLAAGLAYGALRGRIGGLGLTGYALLILPMALDGFTQLFGWRESTPELRTLTGVLFGVASVWLIYPRMDAVLLAERVTVATVLAPSAGRR
jgi:uncharacterized membrane protein